MNKTCAERIDEALKKPPKRAPRPLLGPGRTLTGADFNLLERVIDDFNEMGIPADEFKKNSSLEEINYED